MAKLDATVRREAVAVTLWVTVASVPVQLAFWALGRWDYTVLLGSVLGCATAVGNFLLLGLMIQKALTQDEKQARKTVRLSQGGRLLLQGVILALAAALPYFNIWATVVPLLIPRIAVSVRARRAQNGAPRPSAADTAEDEDDVDDED